MNTCVSKLSRLVLAGAMLLGAAPAFSQTIVYDSIPSPTPPNVSSQGFQCCATSEFGDLIQLAPGTPRGAGYVTVLMSSWSKHSDYPSLPLTGYTHPITLNIYLDQASAAAHTPVKTVTQSVVVPWRPEADPTCPGGTAWRAADALCYNGLAFTITYDLRSLNYTLPDQLIFGVAFNTNTWGYAPIGAPGPYESLNVGLNAFSAPSVGTDVDADAVYWNTAYAPFYTDGGAAGVGIFRRDNAWAPYVPAVRVTTFAFATNGDACKNGGWQTLVRSNTTPFKNQGDCVSYTKNGK